MAYIITITLCIAFLVQKIFSAKAAHDRKDLRKYKADLVVLTIALVGGTVLIVLMRHMLNK
ncbi:hypothetical protein [Pedobacter agri]|jgi:hypothetical protein|uniref:Uncharacterized protein n=1 Tax=Pedobacter agri TaxID=454586 RepID=A0A9X3DFQ2_9SPHI|nr:hypothetical protein [Pedobacter agri]MCX3266315.1 hypothetical protein [Pedobacter agri]RZJ77901.1 MAG: hypothetical protein EOO47_15470 [Flavobacterium sp.]